MPNVLNYIKETIRDAYHRISGTAARTTVSDCRTSPGTADLRGQGGTGSGSRSTGLRVLAPKRGGDSCLAGFRKWGRGLALCSLLLAESAIGATYTVTNDATMTTANLSATYGDVVVVTGSPATVGIRPDKAGAKYRSGTGSRVRVPYIDFNSKRDVTVNGFRTFDIAGGLGSNDSLIDCAVYDSTGAFSVGFSDTVVAVNDTIQVASIWYECTPDGSNNCSNLATRPIGGRIRNSFVYASGHGGSSTFHALGLTGFRSDSNQYVLCTNADQPGDARALLFYQSIDTYWNADTIAIVNRTTERQGPYFRDYSHGNTFDNVYIYQHPSSTGNISAGFFVGSGAIPGTTGSNNLINSKVSVYGYPVYFQNDNSNSVVRGNQLYSWSKEAAFFDISGSNTYNFADSITFEHNSLVSSGTRPAILFEGANPSLGIKPPNSIKYNIFYTLGDPANSLGIYGLQASRATLTQDYNLFYSVDGDSLRSISYNQTPYKAGPGTGWSSTSPFPDKFSRYGNPAFTSISQQSLNLAVSPTGEANGTYWPNGYVGAVNPAGADVTPPEAVSDLSVDENSYFSQTLVWTSPGDDGSTGTASTYDMRYSTSTITSGNFAAATTVSDKAVPQVAGSAESKVVDGLTPGVAYYFAIKTADEEGNWSDISNIASGSTAPDTDGPLSVDPLNWFSETTTTAFLVWEAPEDAVWGQVSAYDIRYSTSAIDDETDWDAATQATGEPTPSTPVTEDSFTLIDLSPSTAYYVAIKSQDASGNWSAFAVATGTTDTPPDVTAPTAITSLLIDCADATSFCLNWAAPTDPEEGAATSYDIRYSTSQIDEGNWASASQLTGAPTPTTPGGEEAWITTATFAAGTRYYIGIKSSDSVGNISALSNVPNEFTTGSPIANGTTLGTISVYPNFNAASIYLPYSGDENNNSTARLFINAGTSASTDTLYEALPLDTLRSEKQFTGSAFWLDEGTQYTVAVSVSDSDGGSQVLTSTFTTRATVPDLALQATRYYVAAWGAGSDSAAGTSAAPFRTLAKAWSVMAPGTGMVLKAGMHVDSLATVAADSGTVSAPKYILGETGAYLSGEDVAYAVSSDWDSVTISGQKMYFKTAFPTYPRTVVFGDSMALFRHPTPNSLLNDSLGTAGNMQYGWARSKTNDTLFVQLEGDASPIGYRAHIASRTYMLDLRSNNVVLDGVGIRYAGTDWRTDYYLNAGISTGVLNIQNAKNVTVRNGLFLNNGWCSIVADSSSLPVRDITIARNTFKHTRVEGWGQYATSNIYQHPVVFMGSGHGGVVRYNTYRGFADGGFRVDELTPKKFGDFDFHDNDMVGWVRNADAVEIDACDCSNVRVWNNRARSGGNFTDTEILRGPVFYLYNRVNNATDFMLLRGTYTDSTWGPVHMYHNTFTSNANNASGLSWISGHPNHGRYGVNNLWASLYRQWDDQNAGWRANQYMGFNYNYIVANAPALLNGTLYTWADSTAFRSTTGWEADGRFTPHNVGAAFADTANGNLNPVASSPAIERGRRIRGVNSAFGVDRYTRATPTIGAVEYDNLRPAPIADLAIVGKTASTATLRWTASGDDSLLWRANNVVVKYSTSDITEGNFAAATSATSPVTTTPGILQYAVVTGLSQDVLYYFAVKTVDDVGQESAVSNVPVTILQTAHFPMRKSFLNNLIRILLRR